VEYRLVSLRRSVYHCERVWNELKCELPKLCRKKLPLS
jgi:hypothetical protein